MKKYLVQVVSTTTLWVEAENEDEAMEKAGEEVWEHNADSTDLNILDVSTPNAVLAR